MKRFYMAIATKNNKYTVAMNGKRLGDVRDFDTFEEADRCAKQISDEVYDGYYPGIYVNNR